MMATGGIRGAPPRIGRAMGARAAALSATRWPGMAAAATRAGG